MISIEIALSLCKPEDTLNFGAVLSIIKETVVFSSLLSVTTKVYSPSSAILVPLVKASLFKVIFLMPSDDIFGVTALP